MEVVESSWKWMQISAVLHASLMPFSWIFTYILDFEIISASVYWFTHSFGFRIVKIIRLVSLAAGKYEQTGTAESRGGAARLTAAGAGSAASLFLTRVGKICQPLSHHSGPEMEKYASLFLTKVGKICCLDQEGGSLFSNRLTWTPYVLCFWFQLILESWCSKVNDELVQLWALFRMFDSSN